MLEFLAVLITFLVGVFFFLLTVLMFAWPIIAIGVVVYAVYWIAKRRKW